ncbi:Uncharacterized protein TCM_001832 [Theobroma cacao]|uniref:RNase H type-1 domain-containing protein n=1 Tax=Theobroma cacao TaxID=3641 RepID=A0A061DK05_THECC|nr:Uncharacterized protein TCM_001832 [Theobroma cacao]
MTVGSTKTASQLNFLNFNNCNVIARKITLQVCNVNFRSPPPTGEFKFNVDNSAKGKPGPVGCNGVLRDSNGHVVGLFFCLIGLHDSNIAELMAILKALKLFAASPYTSSPLIIESDSRVALSWVNSVEKRPWDKWSILNELNSLRITLGTVSFKHIFKEGNDFVDSLAKYGVNNNTSFSAWW